MKRYLVVRFSDRSASGFFYRTIAEAGGSMPYDDFIKKTVSRFNHNPFGPHNEKFAKRVLDTPRSDMDVFEIKDDVISTNNMVTIF